MTDLKNENSNWQIKKVTAHTEIQINCECPHCWEDLDLNDRHYWSGWDDWIMYQLWTNENSDEFMRAKDLDFMVECKECWWEFIVEEVEY